MIVQCRWAATNSGMTSHQYRIEHHWAKAGVARKQESIIRQVGAQRSDIGAGSDPLEALRGAGGACPVAFKRIRGHDSLSTRVGWRAYVPWGNSLSARNSANFRDMNADTSSGIGRCAILLRTFRTDRGDSRWAGEDLDFAGDGLAKIEAIGSSGMSNMRRPISALTSFISFVRFATVTASSSAPSQC